jgi:hydroxypyruvate reductase/glycerate 2-kinase
MIWQAGVAAVDPFRLVREALILPGTLSESINNARLVLIVGGGKAGAAMAAGVEAALAHRLDRVRGLVNVPEGTFQSLRAIRLHGARPAATNQPTAAGVAGVEKQLALVADARPDDVVLCLLSGGGSALLPAPVAGVSLEDKQAVTQLLHACGATIGEMNCVRKHFSRFKGGRLAEAVHAREATLFSLIISDVVGDPLDVIASGPTAPDPSTFADAWAVLAKFGLEDRVPANILAHLRIGAPETPKTLPKGITNLVLGNNSVALAAAAKKATELRYCVLNLGAFIEGDTQAAARFLAGIVRSVRANGQPAPPPLCLLSGGETTVTLTAGHGKGGRNVEFVLAMLNSLGETGLPGVTILSGGTDGEDGPTDAAGAVADLSTLAKAAALALSPNAFLEKHDAYSFFDATGDLMRTGLTGTNVMDLRVILVDVHTGTNFENP